MALKVGLALSGGGTRGMAHIGVLKVLVKNNIPIDLISGTSAGALIGGIYASGTSPEEMEKTLHKMKQKDIHRLMDFGGFGTGFVKGERIMKLASTLLKQKKIEDFRIPFYATATDILTGEEIIFDKGDALVAIKSSITIPGIFPSVKYKNRFLVDGGVINILPADIMKNKGADLIIGVDVMGSLKTKVSKRHGISTKDSILNAITIMEQQIVKYRNQNIKDLLIIKPDVGRIGTMSFDKRSITKAIKMGEIEAKKKIPHIREALRNKIFSI